MARVALALVALALCTQPAGGWRPGRAAAEDAPSAVLRDGPVEGDWVAGVAPRVARFRGIPFAASTAGEGRWRAPEPPAPWWPEVLRATDWGPACAQAPGGPDGAQSAAPRADSPEAWPRA